MNRQIRDGLIISSTLLMVAGIIGFYLTPSFISGFAMYFAATAFLCVFLANIKSYREDINELIKEEPTAEPYNYVSDKKLNHIGFGTNTDRIFEHLDTQYYKSVMGRRV